MSCTDKCYHQEKVCVYNGGDLMHGLRASLRRKKVGAQPPAAPFTKQIIACRRARDAELRCNMGTIAFERLHRLSH
jgi:hypothetical protein